MPWDRYGLKPESLEQWRRWLTAASAAEYESGHHLVAAAADAFFDIKIMDGLEAKWVHALARRLLRHRNPAARKAFLQRLLDHAAPAEVADWPLVRDAVLPASTTTSCGRAATWRGAATRRPSTSSRFYRAAPGRRAPPSSPRAARRRPAARPRGAPRPLRGPRVRGAAGPRIQDDDVAAAAAALEAAGNDAATHALALAVVPLVCCQKPRRRRRRGGSPPRYARVADERPSTITPGLARACPTRAPSTTRARPRPSRR